MLADRAMADEVMNEERGLWEQERTILKARIAFLEGELEKKSTSSSRTSRYMSPASASRVPSQQYITGSKAGSVDGGSVPQESGRREDGTPFYAPAPRNPSRSFENPQVDLLRVDTMTAPGESPITVTSKELTSADFGAGSHTDLETIPETPVESIDISLIQPNLEGVAIRTSAVAPAFIAMVLSPQSNSPAKLSPNVRPPPREIIKESMSSLSREHSTERREKKNTLEVIRSPENTRLTMHAGHTPNHSLSTVDLTDLMNSGSATPTQVQPTAKPHIHAPTCANFDGQVEEPIDEDVELKGQLGLTNDKDKDQLFLTELTEKLELEKRKSENASPSSESGSSKASAEVVEELKGDVDVPRLRFKPSLNFGRPMGSM